MKDYLVRHENSNTVSTDYHLFKCFISITKKESSALLDLLCNSNSEETIFSGLFVKIYIDIYEKIEIYHHLIFSIVIILKYLEKFKNALLVIYGDNSCFNVFKLNLFEII